MDAVTDSPDDPDRAVRDAQAALALAEQRAVIADDHTAEYLHALRAFLAAFASTATLHRMITKRDYHAVREVQDRLDKSMTLAVEAARADVSKAHAEMAQSLIGSIGARASAEMASMARIAWRRTIVLASALPVVALLIGGGIGYWRGYQAGHRATATIIRSAAPIARAVVASGGPAALQDWNRLMMDNPIVPIMNKCHGANLGKQDGRTACNMWLWITPPVPAAPHGST